MLRPKQAKWKRGSMAQRMCRCRTMWRVWGRGSIKRAMSRPRTATRSRGRHPASQFLDLKSKTSKSITFYKLPAINLIYIYLITNSLFSCSNNANYLVIVSFCLLLLSRFPLQLAPNADPFLAADFNLPRVRTSMGGMPTKIRACSANQRIKNKFRKLRNRLQISLKNA